MDQVLQGVLLKAFAGFDTNRDGLIDKTEISSAVAEWFPNLPADAHAAVCEQLLQDGDKNGDGKIDVREFIAYFEGLKGDQVYEDDEGASEDDGEQLDAIFKHMMPDEVDMCRDAFIHMDMDGDGFVSLEELLQVVQSVVGDEEFFPLREYTEPIFIVADKDKDGKLSLREFLASFAQGPGVVPREVIHACVSTIKVHLSDEEIQALQDKFRQIDTKKDGYIDSEELEAALTEVFADKYPNSQEPIKEVVKVVMQAADTDQDGKLSLSEFVRSFQEDQGVMPTAFIDVRSQNVSRQLSTEEMEVLERAFATLKEKGSLVFATYDEMYQAVYTALESSVADSAKVPDLCDLIATMAETDEDGTFTLAMFVDKFKEMVGGNAGGADGEASVDRVSAAMNRLQELLDAGALDNIMAAFRALDVNQDDYLDRVELEGLLASLFSERLPSMSADIHKDLIDAIITTADVDGDGRLSLYEFVMSFASGSGVIPEDVAQDIGEIQRENEEAAGQTGPVELTPDQLAAVVATFKQIDSDADGFVSEDELLQFLGDNLAGFVDDEAGLVAIVQTVMAKADTNQDGRVCFREFLASVLEDETPANAPAATKQEIDSNAIVALHADNLSTPSRQRAQADDDAKSPIVNDVSGCAISDGQLRKEFRKFDADNSGSLDRREFKRAYMNMEHYGLEPTQSEVDRIFSRYGGGDRVTFDEFCVIMLNRSKM